MNTVEVSEEERKILKFELAKKARRRTNMFQEWRIQSAPTGGGKTIESVEEEEEEEGKH